MFWQYAEKNKMDVITAIELKTIAREINIIQDPQESDSAWERRVIYSICGRMAMASLWDCANGETVSVQHLKGRCSEILEAFETICPEIISPSDFGDNDSAIIDCIYDLYCSGGQLYHKRNRIAPSKKTCKTIEGISLMKGLYATDTCFMSGLGAYLIDAQKENEVKSLGFSHPESAPLLDYLIQNAHWNEFQIGNLQCSFLRTIPPFTRGYWTNSPDRDGGISIACYDGDGNGSKQYYLTNKAEGKRWIADLPSWISDNRMHVYLTTEILKRYEILPPIKMKLYKTITEIEIPYRLPPEEETFVKLYSWPKRYDGQEHSFTRIIASELSPLMKKLFVQIGFDVQEEIV